MWLKKLQIAIIERDTESIDKLVSNMPKFTKIDDVKSASLLIKEALKLLYSLKDETRKILQNLKKHKDFLDVSSMDNKKIQRLDIVS